MASGHFGAGMVRAVRDVAADVRLIEIEPQRGVQRYQTGAHLDIAVVVDGLPDIRSYSLVGEAPAGGLYRIAVKDVRDSRGGSRFVRALETGHDVQISDPQSQFQLQCGRPEYLLIAGGIGITPMVGMAQALARHGRPFRLLYAGRTRDQMPFVDDLRELLGERLELFVSADGARLDIEREVDCLDPQGEAYLCGPLRLRDAVQQAWQVRIDQPTGCNSRLLPPEGASRPRISSSALQTNRITKSVSDATVPCSAPSKITGST